MKWGSGPYGLAPGRLVFPAIQQVQFLNRCLLYTSAIHLLDDAMQRYEITPDYLAEIVRDQLNLPCTGRDVYLSLIHIYS